VNTVHPGLAGVLDYSGYRSELFETTSVQLSPLKPADATSPIASVRSGDQAQYWWVFPNLMINAYKNIMDVNIVMPLDAERCRVFFDFYFADEIDADSRGRSIAVADQVQREDMQICEEVQKGLRSANYATGRFSVRREATGYHFHRLIAGRLAGALA
jgi:choline monooxygenase